MIKKLRLKFILISMLAIIAVLTAIISTINIINYNNINSSADTTLQLIATNDGKYPHTEQNELEKPPEESSESSNKDNSKGDVEGEFQNRFFTVTYYNDGTIIADTKNITAINDTTAIKMADVVKNNKKTSGFYGNYKYLCSTKTNGSMYIFLDCAKSLDTFNNFLRSSILISLGGLIVVFILVYFLSAIVFKPVAETYAKQKQFITDANHELKTPLTVIGASCDVLEISGGENEWTKTIKDQVQNLTDLTNKLVFLSRMDEETTKTIMTDFSLSEVGLEVAESYNAISLSQNKKFNINIDKNVTCNGDFNMIKSLLKLLLDNAFKYCNNNGDVTISISTNGKNAKIVIYNTTDNVPIGDLNMLFDRFYRLDGSRNSKTGGHGIGLSVAKAIVDLHKGKITAHSNDGKSIAFTVII